MSERRSRRTGRPNIDTRFYLDHILERHGISALVLATEQGEFVAGSETKEFGGLSLISGIDKDYGSKLARIAPFAAADADRGEQGTWTGRGSEPIWANKVEINGSSYYVAAVCMDGVAAIEAAGEAIQGVGRILAEAA